MTNLLPTIVAKSDQLNSDDLIDRSLTIKITKVAACDTPEQPIAIHFEGDNGKPYKPCKTMRRLLVHVWKGDGNKYVGRRLALYRDEKVAFGGLQVGGIRISHVSDIDQTMTFALAVTRGNKRPFTVKPLPPEQGERRQAAQQLSDEDDFPGDQPNGFDVVAWAAKLLRTVPDYSGVDAMREDWLEHKDELRAVSQSLFKELNQAIANRATEIGAANAERQGADA